MTKHYGKSMADVLPFKKDHFDENEEMLKRVETARKIYCSQIRRTKCKICSSKLPQEKYFVSHNVDYFSCLVCGHINGGHEDEVKFAEEAFEADFHVPAYQESDKKMYFKRMESIYVPKVKFLLDSLENVLQNLKGGIKFFDIGAGAGYMTYAMDSYGLNVEGVELSKTLVEYANRMAGKKLLHAVRQEDVADLVRYTEKECLVFIGVLEHIANLAEILTCIKENKNIKYLYFSVPMLSLSCALEVAFPEILPRQTWGGAHSNLFTWQSIEWIFEKYGYSYISTWSFGADIMDLYRSVSLSLKSNNCHPDFIKRVSDMFCEHGDEMQLIVDKSGFASEVHVVAQVH